MQGTSREQAEALAKGDLAASGIASPLRELLEYCGKLTLTPAAMTHADAEALRRAGWKDRQIAEAVYVTGMFAMFNRIADAFGLVDPAYHRMGETVQPATRFDSSD